MLDLFTSKERPSSSEKKMQRLNSGVKVFYLNVNWISCTSRFDNILFLFVKGNGPGGTSASYLAYWYSQCIGGSGHGGKGGYPAFQDVLNGYSGLEYGRKDTHVLLGGSSGIEM